MLVIKSYFRYLLRNRMYTLVTVFGFALSLAFALLLGVYIKNQLSIDDFQTKKDRVYRLEHESTEFSAPIATDLKNLYPEIEDFTRVFNHSGRISKSDGKKIKFDYLGVDGSFFNLFSFPLLKGDKNEVLQTIDGIVLSKATALRLFGSIDIVGETIFIDTEKKFTITGIMDDFPDNTHFNKQDALINLAAFKKIWQFENILEEYGWCSLSIYLLERPNAILSSKASEILKNFKKDFWLYKEGWANTVVFTPLKEVYFSSKEGNGTKSSSMALISVLSAIVFLILVLAIGNYINLTIAQSTFRGKEVAVKKLLGGSKHQLMKQLVFESFILCFMAILLAVVLAILFEPLVNNLLETELQFEQILNLRSILALLGAVSVIGLISGLVPAIKISSFKPIEVVKGELRAKSRSVYSKVFITFQYSVAIALLSCSWIILKQTDFLRNKDLGFSKDNIVFMEYLGSNSQKKTIKNELEKITGVQEVSLTWHSPLDGGNNQTFDFNEESVSFQEIAVDSSFFNVFDIKIKDTKTAYAGNGVYLNETGYNTLQLNEQTSSFKFHDEELPVLGVVQDFNFRQLKDQIGPLMIRQQDENRYPTNLFVKINGTNLLEITEQLKSVYSQLIGDVEYEIQFVDSAINHWYEKEERTGKIISYFTLLAVAISSIGILAMATFYMQQRKKEIGVRKVNGASTVQMLALLNIDFLKWVFLGFVIGVPISWFVMSRWLENFAYKTSMDWWLFLAVGLFTAFIALLTVSWKSWQAANLNPIESLRME
ncbi:ABC transporter permease [Euzebyella marina]|uniref:ABC transporter permease n=1 Tax=Euzebyella marina TaxID=1761453 RepID=A0A3G2LAW5_9FLAO|nr:ABC transporter permease [Euzebyella marina]AYN69387.1 ABC transporter permease [Euzebyella marina]